MSKVRQRTPQEIKQLAMAECMKRLKDVGPRDKDDPLPSVSGGLRLACLHIYQAISEIKLEVEENDRH